MTKTGRSLTQGIIWKQIVLFALPLLAASLIQLLYNFVNQVFAGQFIGTHASAAIAASGLLLACLVSFFGGLGIGASVIVAQHFAQKSIGDYQKALHTTAALAFAGGAALTIIGVMFAPVFLAWLQTPAEVFDDAVLYLRIYFLSGLPMVVYNLFSGVIRALGDSRSPMFYQLIGGALNLAINILLVAVLQIGVTGPAIATVIAQLASSVLAFRHLVLLDAKHRLYIRRIRFNAPMLTRILAIGVPAGIQTMSIALSNLVIQAQINLLSVREIAAFAYYFQLETFIYNPMLAIGQTVLVFVSHNVAVGQARRAKRGVYTSLVIGLIVAASVAALMLAIAPEAFSLFTRDAETIGYGVGIMQITFPFYFLYALIETFSNAARGCSRSWQPMLIVLVNMCGLRLILLFLFSSTIGGAQAIALVYPITWAAVGGLLAIYYFASHCIDRFESISSESHPRENV